MKRVHETRACFPVADDAVCNERFALRCKHNANYRSTNNNNTKVRRDFMHATAEISSCTRFQWDNQFHWSTGHSSIIKINLISERYS